MPISLMSISLMSISLMSVGEPGDQRVEQFDMTRAPLPRRNDFQLALADIHFFGISFSV